MFKFLRVLARNLLQGPATEAFPFQEAPVPKRFRGRVVFKPERCVGCGVCRHVCPGRAINMVKNEEETGYDFVVWHNTCCLCAMCRHFCPTGAISLSNDWHNTHLQEEKYDWAEHHFVPYARCRGCDAPLRMLPPDLAARVYANIPVDMEPLMQMCPACRQQAEAERINRLAHQNAPTAPPSAGAEHAPSPE